ncbi:protein serine/threonine phosphatase 2C family protein [Candidatus Kaiserbacteria bacterium]|nr:protein serine/threonine phosphatase 2C family protein [Candidatus Kaiserbacteria bacterium]
MLFIVACRTSGARRNSQKSRSGQEYGTLHSDTHTKDGTMVTMSIHGIVSNAQTCGPHEAQEDVVVNISHHTGGGTIRLIGILDGHRGKDTAIRVSKMISEDFDFNAADPAQELRRVVAQAVEDTRNRDSGSTLSLAHIDEARQIVTIAVLGDSPIIVVDGEKVVHRSIDHNVRTNRIEREAAIARGAFYSNGYICLDAFSAASLQLSRALGDRLFDPILSREPDIGVFRIGAQSVVIVGSDGMFDPSHCDDSTKIAEEILACVRTRESASAVLTGREAQGLEDNASLIVWRPRRWWEWFA